MPASKFEYKNESSTHLRVELTFGRLPKVLGWIGLLLILVAVGFALAISHLAPRSYIETKKLLNASANAARSKAADLLRNIEAGIQPPAPAPAAIAGPPGDIAIIPPSAWRREFSPAIEVVASLHEPTNAASSEEQHLRYDLEIRCRNLQSKTIRVELRRGDAAPTEPAIAIAKLALDRRDQSNSLPIELPGPKRLMQGRGILRFRVDVFVDGAAEEPMASVILPEVDIRGLEPTPTPASPSPTPIPPTVTPLSPTPTFTPISPSPTPKTSTPTPPPTPSASPATVDVDLVALDDSRGADGIRPAVPQRASARGPMNPMPAATPQVRDDSSDPIQQPLRDIEPETVVTGRGSSTAVLDVSSPQELRQKLAERETARLRAPQHARVAPESLRRSTPYAALERASIRYDARDGLGRSGILVEASVRLRGLQGRRLAVTFNAQSAISSSATFSQPIVAIRKDQIVHARIFAAYDDMGLAQGENSMSPVLYLWLADSPEKAIISQLSLN